MLTLVKTSVRRAFSALGFRISRIPTPQNLPSGALLIQGVDAYGTHYIPLAAAVARTTGPVLELGMGDHSTPLLHLLCHDRLLVSADSNARWMSRYEAFRSPTHQLHAVADWDRWNVIEQHEWAVCFVDCSPTEHRRELIQRLEKRARYIVVHDTDTDVESAAVFAFEGALNRFRFRSDYRVFRPYTTVVSNVEPFVMTEADGAGLT
jgi:hypothetical protein